jgi:hypothetical protein
MYRTHHAEIHSTIRHLQTDHFKEKIMKRKPIAMLVACLFTILLFSACYSSPIVIDLSAVYAAAAEPTMRLELVDRQDLAEYMATLSYGFVPAESAETSIQGNFLAERQSLAEYQATLADLIFIEHMTPAVDSMPLALNDHQDVANYQMWLSHGFGQ